MITTADWDRYDRQGYLRLGKLLNSADLAALQERINQIMLGNSALDYGNVMMQLDSDSGRYEDSKAQTKGHKGATLAYRKIEDLELDPLFLAYIQRPIFQEICDRVYGEGGPIACFRAMFMNKPARRGTFLPWHQDRWTFLDRDPVITLWTALDPATRANGCVQIVPGSHRVGLINPSHMSGFLTPEQSAQYAVPGKVEFLELEAGDAVLLHNHLLHASDVNATDNPRRAFSVCYMPASTVANNGQRFRTVFGAGAMSLVRAGGSASV
jgi:phytanoyl-CoA hydroxylase